MDKGDRGSAAATLDPAETTLCAAASQWFGYERQFRTLHLIGPARLTFLRDAMVRHFAKADGGLRPLEGLSILDIGCGGGLVCEPLARLGARVTGIDPAIENIEAARRHAAGQDLSIDYRPARVEELAAEGAKFDAVACLEVVEHVPDPAAFLKLCAALVRPGGLLLSPPSIARQGVPVGHCRRGVCAALAARRHASVGALRDAAGIAADRRPRGRRADVQGLVYSRGGSLVAVRRHGHQLFRRGRQASLSRARRLYRSHSLVDGGMARKMALHVSVGAFCLTPNDHA